MGRLFDCVCVGLTTVDVISLLGRPLREDEKLLAEAAARLRARFGFRCAVTAGEKGVYWFDEARGRVALLRQRRCAALDTTGCGDVFHGAFLAAYLRRPDFEAGLRFAQRAAGLKTLGLGGRASIPARAEV